VDKEYLARLSKDERARVKNMLRAPTPLDARALFRDASVSSLIEGGSKTVLGGYDSEVLPSVGLFYDHVLVEICPRCRCVANPKLLESFLERKLVVPVLRAGYEEYPVEFAETILQYPHVSFAEFGAFRFVRLVRQAHICSHCLKRFKNRCMSAAEHFLGTEEKALLRKSVADTFDLLSPVGRYEALLVQELENAMKEGDLSGIRQIESLAVCIEWFRTAQAYSAVPQVSLKRLETVDRSIRKDPNLKRTYDISEINESVLQGLRLSYRPDIPLETYLDIVLSRRDKIRRLVSDLVERSKPSSQTFYINLQTEVEKVNEEVRTIDSSKRAKLLSFATGFISRNKSVIAGCLSGAAIGLKELGPVGCASGFLAGSAGGEILRRAARIEMPPETREIKRAIAAGVEPVYEGLLSRYLSKNINMVQVWQLQKKVQAG